MRYAAAVLALAVSLTTVPLQGQNVSGFRSDVREIDPDRQLVLRVQQVENGTLAYVQIADAWYYLPCFKRQRLAKGIRELWRENGGSNIVIVDKAGTEVADFQIIGSDFDIKGCD